MWKLAKCLQLSSMIINEIKVWEGFEGKAYKDVVGIWTIGYGHTDGVKQGWVCTREQAEKWLIQDLESSERVVRQHVDVPLSQGMYDALVSFVFNVGPGAKDKKDGFVTLKNGNRSTMLRKLNDSDYQGAADELPKWANADGKQFAGLVKRRAREREFFLKDGINLYANPPKDFVIESPPAATQKQGFWAWLKSLFGVK